MQTAPVASLARDNEGFLLDPADWNIEIGQEIAQQENVCLSDDHWFVIHFIRRYFEDRQVVPAARFALKQIKLELSAEKATRQYLYKLFPRG